MLSNKIASISNLGIVETLDIDKVNIEHVMMEKEGTNLKDVNVIDDCFNRIGNEKDFAVVLESIFKDIFNNLNTMKLK